MEGKKLVQTAQKIR